MSVDPQPERSLRAVFTVTVETRTGAFYFDHGSFVISVASRIEGALEGREDIRAVTVVEAEPAVPADRATVLREAAAAIEEAQHLRDDTVNDTLGFLDNNTEQQHRAVHRSSALLRRMADEAGGSVAAEFVEMENARRSFPAGVRPALTQALAAADGLNIGRLPWNDRQRYVKQADAVLRLMGWREKQLAGQYQDALKALREAEAGRVAAEEQPAVVSQPDGEA